MAVQVAASDPKGNTVTDAVTFYYEGKSASGQQTGSGGPEEPAGLVVSDPEVNGQRADQSPGPDIVAGGQVEITIVVTNSGGSTLTGVAGSTPAGPMQCTSSSLAPGESTQCSLSGTAGYGPVDLSATAGGLSPSGDPVTKTVHVFFTGVAAGGAQSGADGNSDWSGGLPGNGQQVSQYPSGAVSAGGGSTAPRTNTLMLVLGLLSLLAAGAMVELARRYRRGGASC